MNQALSQKLVEVTADTLEKLAFIFAFPAETSPVLDGQEIESVRVGFSGPFCGTLELSLPAAALTELAINMLGSEDGDLLAMEQQHDALRELANVVCGNLLPALAGEGAEFSLHPPSMAPVDNSTGCDAEAVGYLMLEGGPCRVRLQLDRQPPLGPDGMFPAGANP